MTWLLIIVEFWCKTGVCVKDEAVCSGRGSSAEVRARWTPLSGTLAGSVPPRLSAQRNHARATAVQRLLRVTDNIIDKALELKVRTHFRSRTAKTNLFLFSFVLCYSVQMILFHVKLLSLTDMTTLQKMIFLISIIVLLFRANI